MGWTPGLVGVMVQVSSVICSVMVQEREPRVTTISPRGW